MHKEVMDELYLGDPGHPSILNQVAWVRDGHTDPLSVKRELVHPRLTLILACSIRGEPRACCLHRA